MSPDVKIKTIAAVYEAFGRGDVNAILDAVTDDVDWAAEAASAAAPWYGIRHGKNEVAEFFAAFGATMEVEEFTPVSFAANDTDVHTVVRFRARSRSRSHPRSAARGRRPRQRGRSTGAACTWSGV